MENKTEDDNGVDWTEYLNNNEMKVKGKELIPPIKNWSELETRLKVRKYLSINIQLAKYKTPSPVQMQVIPLMMSKRELIVAAPTGSGKTAAYTIPILHLLNKPHHTYGVRALIILPTNELSNQVENEFIKLSLRKPFKITELSKSKTLNYSIDENTGINNSDIIITTPQRLLHLVEVGGIKFNTLQYLVLDEADNLLSGGFLQQLDEIISGISNPNLVISLFSATITPEVEQLCKSFMKDPIRISIGKVNTVVSEVKQTLVYTGSEEGKIVALKRRIRSGIRPPVLIFVQSIERANELLRELMLEDINVDVITSDKTTAQREATITKFRDGKIWILIATNLLARGMDFLGISLVINFDLPSTAVDYIHRAGRTGRMGRHGEAESYYTDADVPLLNEILDVIKSSGQEVPEYLKHIAPLSEKVKSKLATAPIKREHILPNPELHTDKAKQEIYKDNMKLLGRRVNNNKKRMGEKNKKPKNEEFKQKKFKKERTREPKKKKLNKEY